MSMEIEPGSPKAIAIDKARRHLCDQVIERATALMAEGNVPPDMIIDRLLTFGAGHIVARRGKTVAADVLRLMAQKIEDGAFDSVKAQTPH